MINALNRAAALLAALALGRVAGWPISPEHVATGCGFVLVLPLTRYLLASGAPSRGGWVMPAVRESLMTVAVAATTTTVIGFALDLAVSRRLLLLQAGLTLVAESAVVLRRRSQSMAGELLRLAVVCDDAEFEELVRAVAEHDQTSPQPGRPRIDITVRLVGLLEQQVLDITDEALDRHRRVQVPTAAINDLKSVCGEQDISLVLVGQGWLRDPQFLGIAEEAQDVGVRMASLPGFFEQHFLRVPINCLDPVWFFDLTHERRASYRRFQQGVSLLAAIAAGSLLLLLGPLIAAAILIDSGRPVLHRQARLGLHGNVFEMLKFRTMRTDAEVNGPVFAREADPRVTRVGRLLRKTRLDELPQLVNILRGDMTFIGPRPERPEFAGGFAGSMPYYGRRLLLRPGLTGWAQVNEDYAASAEETARKLERDLFYLKYQSLSLDAVILARTARSVLHVRGR